MIQYVEGIELAPQAFEPLCVSWQYEITRDVDVPLAGGSPALSRSSHYRLAARASSPHHAWRAPGSSADFLLLHERGRAAFSESPLSQRLQHRAQTRILGPAPAIRLPLERLNRQSDAFNALETTKVRLERTQRDDAFRRLVACLTSLDCVVTAFHDVGDCTACLRPFLDGWMCVG